MASITRFITKRLKLKVNEAKSAVDEPENRKFLGFTFSNGGYRRGPRRKIAPKAIKRFKDRVRALTSRTGGKNLKRVVAALKPYLLGWIQYFGFAQSKQCFASDGNGTFKVTRNLVPEPMKGERYHGQESPPPTLQCC